MARTLLHAPSAWIGDRLIEDATVLIGAAGIVEAAGPRSEVAAADATIHEVEGVLLPGLVDIQVNGMGGRGCEEEAADALDVVAETAWRGGAAAFLPTLITAPMDELCARATRAAAWIEGFDANTDAAVPLGLHVEGPFLEIPGAHDGSLLIDPTPERVDALIDACRGQLRLVTLAPGRAGAAAATARFRAAGVAVSLGHAKSIDGFADCVDAGATCVTHLFNVMSGLHHREPGIVGFALDEPRVSCGIILDGVHVHPAVARLACRVLGPDRTVVVTDAANAAGMPDGEYQLSGMPVTLADGVVRDREGRLAGSTLTMAKAASFYLREIPGADAAAIAAVASRNPARIAAAPTFGWIGPGSVARFVTLDRHGELHPSRF